MMLPDDAWPRHLYPDQHQRQQPTATRAQPRRAVFVRRLPGGCLLYALTSALPDRPRTRSW